MGDFHVIVSASNSDTRQTRIQKPNNFHHRFVFIENTHWKIYEIGEFSEKNIEILHAFEKDPLRAPLILNKDCAYLALRKRDSTLFAARDPFGFVPLRFVRKENQWIIFTGPEIPLKKLPVDHHRLLRFITQIPDRGENDFFIGVKRILPGHTVHFSATTYSTFRYYKPDTTPLNENIEILSQKFKEGLFSAIPPSDAIALSGGLDSSSMLPVLPNINSYTMVSQRFPSANESKEVTELSAFFGIKNTLFNIDSNVIWKSPEDFSDPNYAGYGPIFHPPVFGERDFFQSIADQSTGPILTGIGGDNILNVSLNLVARSYLKKGNLRTILKLRKKFPSTVYRQLLTTPIHRIESVLPQKVANMLVPHRRISKREFPWIPHLPSFELTPVNWGTARRDRILTWSWERVTRLLDSHGRSIDRAIVSPWMSSKVWNLLLRVSPEILFHQFRNKGFLRYAMQDILPENIRLAGKSKHFGKPVEYQLLKFENEIYTLFDESKLAQNGLIDQTRFQTEFGELCTTMESNLQFVNPSPTMIYWPTIASELWLKYFV